MLNQTDWSCWWQRIGWERLVLYLELERGHVSCATVNDHNKLHSDCRQNLFYRVAAVNGDVWQALVGAVFIAMDHLSAGWLAALCAFRLLLINHYLVNIFQFNYCSRLYLYLVSLSLPIYYSAGCLAYFCNTNIDHIVNRINANSENFVYFFDLTSILILKYILSEMRK